MKKILLTILTLVLALSAFCFASCGDINGILGGNSSGGEIIEEIASTEGLEFKLSNNGAYYICTGIGTALTTDIVIGTKHNGMLIKEIADNAFGHNETIQSVVISGSVQSISDYAFYNCSSLTSVTIGNSVQSIGESAFEDCDSLTSIEIPDSVTSIGEKAFYDCSSLTSITYNGTKAQWEQISKTSSWNYDTGDYIIYCTNGNITKS